MLANDNSETDNDNGPDYLPGPERETRQIFVLLPCLETSLRYSNDDAIPVPPSFLPQPQQLPQFQQFSYDNSNNNSYGSKLNLNPNANLTIVLMPIIFLY
ncbi:10006_t:CDS:2 [Entrophospora sp. SA101]|nr:14021_t:CDS:2 [Entrophospora sp. SA101]CAJ0766115.1 10006_t:CDS:2 [Entrophospora sp. SA101]